MKVTRDQDEAGQKQSADGFTQPLCTHDQTTKAHWPCRVRFNMHATSFTQCAPSSLHRDSLEKGVSEAKPSQLL